VHPSCQTLGAELRCGQYKYAMSNSSLPPASAKAIRNACSLATSEFRAGSSELYRTATSIGYSTSGTLGYQTASLVVAARPSAGRSPALARNAKCRPPGACQTRMGSGTLPLVKFNAVLHRMRQPPPSVISVVACGPGGRTMQSKTKVSRCSVLPIWLGRERKGGGSKTAPNPSVEGMAKRLRLLSTPHLER
jgi:hypothetical protein